MSFSTFPHGQPHRQRSIVLFNLNIKIPSSFAQGLMVILSRSKTAISVSDEESSFSRCSEMANQIHFIDFEKFKNRFRLN